MYNDEFQDIKNSIIDIAKEITENGIDTLAENNILKEIPIVDIVCVIAKGIVGIRNSYQKKMIQHFLKTVALGVATPGEINIHLENLKNNHEQLEKEISLILKKIDDWIEKEKVLYLGNIYVAYIQRKINWDFLVFYVEILSRLIIKDIDILDEIYKEVKEDYSTIKSKIESGNIRLENLGLVTKFVRKIKYVTDGDIKEREWTFFRFTDEGFIFYNLIKESGSRLISHNDI